MNDSTFFDWVGLLRLGVRQLGLRPTEFWALTPAEFLLMLGAEAGPGAMNRSALIELSNRYPDVRKGMAQDDTS